MAPITYQDLHRFDSFAPVWEGNSEAKWFVDGEDYMSEVGDAIHSAKHEIFITDWQMNPDIFLKRPEAGVRSLEWRLDKLLLKKASEGVRIYILLYWETKSFLMFDILDTGSEHVPRILTHKNITVVRHPIHSTIVKNPEDLLRWSHHEKVIVIDRSIAFVGGIDLAFGRWDTHEHSLVDDHPPHLCVHEEKHCEQPVDKEPKKCQRWIGKDYGNTFVGGSRTDFDKPLLDYIDRRKVPRMPWHDVSCMFTGAAVLDVAKHFIQRYNFINTCSWLSWMLYGCRQLSMESWYNEENNYTLSNPSASNVSIQVVRSLSEWSAGQPQEDSIHKAYLHAIKKSQHFIYIENQFFISSQPNNKPRKVFNGIQQAICDRIVRAYEENEDFHVFIVLPLQPELPGHWGTGSDKDRVSYWNYATLFSGEDSLMSRLKEKLPSTVNIHHYLSVYGLRTHGILDNSVVTEIIYVHSKIMIVDDRLAIIGSANINDRSMLGDRDSEVDVVIEDREMIEGTMNGRAYPVGRFSHGLRCHLFKEHLGLLGDKKAVIELDVEDPLRFEFCTELSKIASSNTHIYEMVFRPRILPTDHVTNQEELKNWLSFKGTVDYDQKEAKKELEGVRGNIVHFPSLFLKDDLKPCNLDYLYMYVDNRGLPAGHFEDSVAYA